MTKIAKYLIESNTKKRSNKSPLTDTSRHCCAITRVSFFLTQPLVVKPDQLIKRRGKLGLIAVNKNFQEVKKWVTERMGKDQKIGNCNGKLRNFIIEPFIPHKDAEEAYVCIYSHRTADTILFYHQGGVDIGDVDAKALKLEVPVGSNTTLTDIEKVLLKEIPAANKS